MMLKQRKKYWIGNDNFKDNCFKINLIKKYFKTLVMLSQFVNTLFKKIKSVTFFNQISKKVHASPKLQQFLIFLLIFVLGISTTMMYFFSFIGLTIGILYFFLLRNPLWKRYGIMIAWIAGSSALILNGIGMLNATGAPSISTTYLSLTIGPIAIVSYTLFLFVWRTRYRRKQKWQLWISKLQNVSKGLPKIVKLSMTIAMILLPVIFWWSISMNLNVLFDNESRLLWVHAPTTVNKGSEFEVTVEAWDANERLSATYKGTVEFSIVSYNLATLAPLRSVSASLPSAYSFTGQYFGSDLAYEIRDGRDNGIHVFTARINTPGIHYILVHDFVTQNSYWSNPIIVSDVENTDPKIYWGDIHCHSALSDGSGSPEHHFYYAQNIACLDFNALTDHGETMQFTAGALEMLEKSANDAYQPGKFVSFQGIEWTNAKTGHFTCIFSDNKLIKNPVLSYFSVSTPQQLWKALDDFTNSTGCRALALPHHTTKDEYIMDWTYINPKYVKIVEVTSVHGECLFEQRDPLNYRGCGDPPPVYTPGTSIMDAFKMGYRMTLYASSDEHDGHPGHSLGHTDAYIGHQRPWTTWVNRIDLPYPGGLTAVRALSLTRSSIFSGLEHQRIYASSDHGRPFLDFTINGVPVGDGSTLEVSNPQIAREINIMIAQDGAPPANKRPLSAYVTPDWKPNWRSKIEIFKNGELVFWIPIDKPVARVKYVDTLPIRGTSYGLENCIEKDGQYYINDYSDNPVNPATLNTRGADFYVVRVVGENGRAVYSGPIWVESSI